jgi:8-hydroxy-5-deazaflavin:NADPH oxidoreductase
MNIVIAGAGNVGRALGGGWVRAGHKVTFAVRDPGKPELSELKQRGASVIPLTGGAAAGDVIVLSIPWPALEASIKALGPMAGKVVVDATNPLTADFSLAIGHDDSAGETVARRASGARVIKAFNTTGFNNMADSGYAAGKLAMMVAGDDGEAKKIVLALASDLGFEAIDAGPLSMSRYLEPMAMVWIKLAIAQKMGRDFGFAILRR